jgi:hypothetical protein
MATADDTSQAFKAVEALFAAVAIIDSVALALKAHIGPDWPASIPYFPDALKTAASLITDVADEDIGKVDDGGVRALADRARQIMQG